IRGVRVAVRRRPRREELPGRDRRACAAGVTLCEPWVIVVEADRDGEGARAARAVGIAAAVAVFAALQDGRLAVLPGAFCAVRDAPLGEAVASAGTASRHVEGRVTRRGVELAASGAAKRAPREAER